MKEIAERGAERFATALRGARSIYHACVLTGTAEGRVFADDTESFLLVWSTFQDGFQLMGAPMQEDRYPELLACYHDDVVPLLQSRELECMEYGADTPALAQMMERVFLNKTICSEQQKLFRHTDPPRATSAPQGYRIERVNDAFLGLSYANIRYLTSELVNARTRGDRQPWRAHVRSDV